MLWIKLQSWYLTHVKMSNTIMFNILDYFCKRKVYFRNKLFWICNRNIMKNCALNKFPQPIFWSGKPIYGLIRIMHHIYFSLFKAITRLHDKLDAFAIIQKLYMYAHTSTITKLFTELLFMKLHTRLEWVINHLAF